MSTLIPTPAPTEPACGHIACPWTRCRHDSALPARVRLRACDRPTIPELRAVRPCRALGCFDPETMQPHPEIPGTGRCTYHTPRKG